MPTWRALFDADPLEWLLHEETPGVRHLALRQLLDLPGDAPQVREAQAAAMRSDPIAAILNAQESDGYWVKPGPGYTPKYQGTVWSLMFLDQMGADSADPRIQAACAYALAHTQTSTGGFASWEGGAREEAPPPSLALHCLNGNLLRALIGFGWLDDERVQRAIDWQARAITGEDDARYYRSGTTGPGFRCNANEGLPCAWGAIKALLALARIPASRREPRVERAIAQGAAFLLSVDPVSAAYPAGYGNTEPSPLWFKLGFPLGYTSDLLQLLQTLCRLGYAREPAVVSGAAWLLDKRAPSGRWLNEAPPRGKMWVEVDTKGAESKWVTLAACSVLKAVYG